LEDFSPAELPRGGFESDVDFVGIAITASAVVVL